MCLGGGGGYAPQAVKKAPEAQPGPASPNDMVNNLEIPNANDRSSMEGNRNAMDPASKSSGSTSTPNKDKMKLLTGKQHTSSMALDPTYRQAFQRGELSGQEGGINL